MTQANGKPVPGVAPAAKQMGRHVARDDPRALARRADATRSPTSDYGNLATIGRMAAVVDLGKLQFSGVLAWWFWLVVHVFFLIGFRNRLVVLLNWAWAYWSYQRAARIILGLPRPRPSKDDAECKALKSSELAHENPSLASG